MDRYRKVSAALGLSQGWPAPRPSDTSGFDEPHAPFRTRTFDPVSCRRLMSFKCSRPSTPAVLDRLRLTHRTVWETPLHLAGTPAR